MFRSRGPGCLGGVLMGDIQFEVDGATAADGTDLAPVLHHDPLRSDLRGYLDRGTESLRNVGLATTGRDAELTPASSG